MSCVVQCFNLLLRPLCTNIVYKYTVYVRDTVWSIGLEVWGEVSSSLAHKRVSRECTNDTAQAISVKAHPACSLQGLFADLWRTFHTSHFAQANRYFQMHVLQYHDFFLYLGADQKMFMWILKGGFWTTLVLKIKEGNDTWCVQQRGTAQYKGLHSETMWQPFCQMQWIWSRIAENRNLPMKCLQRRGNTAHFMN